MKYMIKQGNFYLSGYDIDSDDYLYVTNQVEAAQFDTLEGLESFVEEFKLEVYTIITSGVFYESLS